MKTTTLLILSVLAPAQLACARLGESEKELTARFGAASSRSSEKTIAQGKIHEIGVRLTFRQGDWTIESVIIEGRCAREIYRKKGEWSEEQFATVLNSNAQGGKWNPKSEESMKKVLREWRRDDGATAAWKLGTMTITHPAFERAKAVTEAKAKAESARAPKI